MKLLGLPIEKHLNPYTIGWIKATKKIEVKKRCKVPFSIVRYQDEVYCDMVDMDACQLLFGRLWQYDLDAQHAGKENVYTLEKNGVKFTLLPLRSGVCAKVPKVDKWTFFTITHSEHKMGAAIKESRVVHVLVVKQVLTAEEKKRSIEHPMEVKEILEEFNSILPKDLLEGLPPMRDIQHHIYLTPGASLPNLPHHRMNPREREILKKKVEDLLSKRGHIQDSMSQCAILALLTPKKNGSWRMYVDSRAINKITVGYKFSIPRLDDTLDRLSGAVVFSKIDMRSGTIILGLG